MTPALAVLAADTELAEPVAAGWQLVLAALAGIALIVVLITVAKLHPFLALIFGALTVGIVAGVNIGDVLESFADGFGTTAVGDGARGLDHRAADVLRDRPGFADARHLLGRQAFAAVADHGRNSGAGRA